MEVLLLAIVFFSFTAGPTAPTIYSDAVVPCAVSYKGKITVRESCGVLPVASPHGAQPVPNPYQPTGD